MWAELTGIIVSAGMITGAVIYIYKTRQRISTMDIEKNAALIENPSRTEFTDGYSHGLLMKIRPRKNGCSLVEFFPIDINQNDKKELPQKQSLVVKDDCIKPFARSELSYRREVIKLIGRSNADLPEKMRDTEEGKWMAKESQKAWIINTWKSAITNGDEAIAEAMSDFARGNIAKNVMAEMKSWMKQQMKSQGKQDVPDEKVQE